MKTFLTKRLLMASAVALTLGSAASAQASSSINFDMNGLAPGGLISVDTFDWAPDNALVVNGANPAAAQPLSVLAQGSLASFIKAGSPAVYTSPFAGTEYTFQLNLTEIAAGIGGATVALTPLAGTINIFYDSSADANQLAGTGYGVGAGAVLILTGNVVLGAGSNGTFTDLTVLAPGAFPISPLDQFAGSGNNYPTVGSDQGSGNTNLDFDVIYANPDFFKSLITSLSVDMQDSTNNTTPFKQADPAALVGGAAPVFTVMPDGSLVNGQPGVCAASGQTQCDFLIQTDASTTFNPVPEPGMLALFGIALSALGWSRRRSA